MASQLLRMRQLPALVDFLKRQEWLCVGFSSHLAYNGGAMVPPREREQVLLQLDDAQAIRMALLHTADGLCFPIFRGECDNDELLMQVQRLSVRWRPRVVMGRARDTLRLIGLLRRRTCARVCYQMMSRRAEAGAATRTGGAMAAGYTASGNMAVQATGGTAVQATAIPRLIVRRAADGDLNQLVPLQLAYMQEESSRGNRGVLLSGGRPTAGAAQRVLRAMLAEQLVYVAVADGRVVAKAGTNARGFRYDQIGGVYTMGGWRGRGAATLVLRRLIAHVAACRKAVCLFVKPENRAAIRLYQTLGFQIQDAFQVHYL